MIFVNWIDRKRRIEGFLRIHRKKYLNNYFWNGNIEKKGEKFYQISLVLFYNNIDLSSGVFFTSIKLSSKLYLEEQTIWPQVSYFYLSQEGKIGCMVPDASWWIPLDTGGILMILYDQIFPPRFTWLLQLIPIMWQNESFLKSSDFVDWNRKGNTKN